VWCYNAGVVSSPEAAAAVLTAVREHSDSITHPHTVILGAEVISPSEVASVLRRAKPRRSLGEDGITNKLYPQFYGIFIPFISRMFSIICSTHSFPPSFSAGVITFIYKRGPLALPSSYRPITLLNTDYCLLPRIIAPRLSRALSTVIHPSQTAFLKGRRIGDNISMLQLLPDALRCKSPDVSRSLCVVAFLDFAKAYDTVLKTFLEIHHDTNGCGSRFPRLDRPLPSTITNQSYASLYLFIGQALSCLKRVRPSHLPPSQEGRGSNLDKQTGTKNDT
jgi:hypothetical protein